MNARITFDDGVIRMTLIDYPYLSVTAVDNKYFVYKFPYSETMKEVVGEFSNLADAVECILRNK